MRNEPISGVLRDTERETLQGKTLKDHPASLCSPDNLGKSARNRPILSAAIRNYGLLSGRFQEAFPPPVPRRAGGFLVANARDLRPLAAGSARRNFFLAPQAAQRNPPLRLLAPRGTHG